MVSVVFPKNRLVRSSVSELETSEGGCRYSASFDTGITGRGFDIIIVDDPISAHNAMSVVERRKNVEVFNTMIASRLDLPEQGVIIVVAQRLHDDDLPGVLIRQGGSAVPWPRPRVPTIIASHPPCRTRTPGKSSSCNRWATTIMTPSFG